MSAQQGNPRPGGDVVPWWAAVRHRAQARRMEDTAAMSSRGLPKMEVRRVRRVVRKIDPWTVLKTSLVFNAIAGLVFVLGMWVTWSIAVQRGIPQGIASIFEALTLTFTPNGELYFRALVLLTIVMVVVATAAMTLGAVVYNLISDMVGGVEFTVLEETFQPLTPAMLRQAAASRVTSGARTTSTTRTPQTMPNASAAPPAQTTPTAPAAQGAPPPRAPASTGAAPRRTP